MVNKKKKELSKTKSLVRNFSLEKALQVADGSLDMMYGMFMVAFEDDSSRLLRKLISNGNYLNPIDRLLQHQTTVQIEEKLVLLEENVSEKKEKVETARAKLLQAEEALAEAQRIYESAKRNFDEANISCERAEIAYCNCQTELANSINAEKNLDTNVLLHISTTLAQLKEYSDYRLVVTNIDAPYLEALGIIDEEFKKECSEITINIPPTVFFEIDIKSSEWQSIEAYAKMVAWHILKEIPFITVYANKIIEEVLDYNGLI